MLKIKALKDPKIVMMIAIVMMVAIVIMIKEFQEIIQENFM